MCVVGGTGAGPQLIWVGFWEVSEETEMSDTMGSTQKIGVSGGIACLTQNQYRNGNRGCQCTCRT